MRKLSVADFTVHPASVGESYWEHFREAFYYGRRLIASGFAALIHAVFPFWHESTASRNVTELHKRMLTRLKQ